MIMLSTNVNTKYLVEIIRKKAPKLVKLLKKFFFMFYPLI